MLPAMGNREALLAGAKRCLIEKGYAATTARDIATASGVSLAAIGYHFGSKDALMNQAMMEAIGEWGDRIEQALAGVDLSGAPLDRFEAVWTRILATFETDRPLWAATFELFPVIERNPELRKVIAEAYGEARSGLAALFLGIPEEEVD